MKTHDDKDTLLLLLHARRLHPPGGGDCDSILIHVNRAEYMYVAHTAIFIWFVLINSFDRLFWLILLSLCWKSTALLDLRINLSSRFIGFRDQFQQA